MLRSTTGAGRFYDLIGSPRLLLDDGGELWTNMGLWRGAAGTLADANRAMCRAVIAAAEIAPGAIVADVGCGTGTALRMAATTTEAAYLYGVNASSYQVRLAEERIAGTSLAERVSFVHADACRLPFRDGEIDTVISIEAAFHFATRRAFFAEVGRVLAPGGRLVVADLVPPTPRGPVQRLNAWALGRGLQIPAQNFGAVARFEAELRCAGLVGVRVRDITDAVVPPYRAWFRSRSFQEQVAWSWVGLWLTAGFFSYPWRYVVATASKPAPGAELGHDVVAMRNREGAAASERRAPRTPLAPGW